MAKSFTKNLYLNFCEMSKNEQEKYANQFSEGNTDLKYALLNLWRNGVYTYACCGGHSYEEQRSEAENFGDGLIGAVNQAYLMFDISTLTEEQQKKLLELLILNVRAGNFMQFDFSMDNMAYEIDNIDGPARRSISIRLNKYSTSYLNAVISGVVNNDCGIDIALNTAKETLRSKKLSEDLSKNEIAFINSIIKLGQFSFEMYLESVEKHKTDAETISRIILSMNSDNQLKLDVSDKVKTEFKIDDKGQIIIAAEGMFTKDENDKNKFYTLVGNEMKTLTKDQIKGLTEFSKDRKYNYSKEFQVGDVKNLLDDMVETCKLSSNLEV